MSLGVKWSALLVFAQGKRTNNRIRGDLATETATVVNQGFEATAYKQEETTVARVFKFHNFCVFCVVPVTDRNTSLAVGGVYFPLKFKLFKLSSLTVFGRYVGEGGDCFVRGLLFILS